MAIIVALGGAGYVAGSKVILSGKINAAKTDAAAIATAVAQYKFEMRKYPASLTALTTADSGKGPWIHSSLLKDPWNKDFHYIYNENTGFAIISAGQDGTYNTFSTNNASGTIPTEISKKDVGVISR